VVDLLVVVVAVVDLLVVVVAVVDLLVVLVVVVMDPDFIVVEAEGVLVVDEIGFDEEGGAGGLDS